MPVRGSSPIGDENICEAVSSHHLGLSDLCHCNAAGTVSHLKLRKLRYFVGLGVGPQGHVMSVCEILNETNVIQHDFPVDQKCGGIKILKIHGELLLYIHHRGKKR